MEYKLYKLTETTSLRKCYRSNYFLHIGNSKCLHINVRCFVNIKSGTIVDSAIWRDGTDVDLVEPTEEQKISIDKILKTKKTHHYINRLKEYK